MLARKTTLAELISKALVDGFSDDVIKTGPLKTAIYFMYINEIITKDTYFKLLMVTKNACWYPVAYYEDGTVKYVFSKDLAKKTDINESYTMKYNPRKVLTWIVDVLKKDELIHDYLSLDSYRDLLLSAKDICVRADFSGIETKADELGLDVVLYKSVLFYFISRERSCTLFYKAFDQVEPFWVPSLGKKVREGMSGDMIHIGDDFYFKFNNMASYLHINVESGLQEIIQNIIILDYSKNGCLLYRDVCEESLYLQDINGRIKKLAKYEEDKCYLLRDNYVLVNSKFTLEIPERLYFNKSMGSASAIEKTQAFWKYFLSNTLAIDVRIELNDEMIMDQLRDMTDNSILSLENMQNVMVFLAENKLCEKEDIIPFANILEKFDSIGVDKNEDITNEIYTLVKYQTLINDECDMAFSASYSQIVCELSEQEDFWTCLKKMPEVLFVRHIKKFETKIPEIIRSDERDMFIGVFDVVNKQLQVIISPVNCGKVVGNQVVYRHDTEGWKGSFCYDMALDKFIARWPVRDVELLNEVCKRFKVNNRYVHFDFYEEKEEEPDWEDDEDDERDELIEEVERMLEEIGDILPFS